MKNIEKGSNASTCGDVWAAHHDRIYSSENATPIHDRRSNHQKCFGELLPEYIDSRKLIRIAKKKIDEKDLSQKSVANSIDRELTEKVRLFKERSKDLFFGSYMDLSMQGILNAPDLEVEILKLHQTMNKTQIANRYRITEVRVREILKNAYKRFKKTKAFEQLPLLWFYNTHQADIIRGICILPPMTNEMIAEKLNVEEDEILIELAKIQQILKALNKVENLIEKIEPEVLSKLGIRQRIIYILSENEVKNKEIAKALCISESNVRMQKTKIRRNLKSANPNPSNFRGVCHAN